MRLLACTLLAAWFALGAPGDPLAATLQPDPPPAAHHPARVIPWTYTYDRVVDGVHWRCSVYPSRPRRCRRA